ncbi:hypothetical protein JOM56_004081 [Amanita muscaria]
MSYESFSQRSMSPAGIVIPDLPHGSYQIFAAAPVRYYHAQLGPKAPVWEYSGYHGTLIFGKSDAVRNETCHYEGTTWDLSEHAEDYWFRLLISKSGEPKVVWAFKVFGDLNYEVDKPFFHVIYGLTRRYGFLFDDDGAATIFAHQVHANYTTPASEKLTMPRPSGKFRSKSYPAKLGFKIQRSPTTKISAPVVDSFRHVVHIGLNKFGALETRGPKSSEQGWGAILSSLRSSKSSSGNGSSACGTDENQDLAETTRLGVMTNSPDTATFTSQVQPRPVTSL